MTNCSHCGYPVEPEAKLCPHCGADLHTVWPPPPEGTIPVDPKPSRPWEAKEQVNSGAVTGCSLGCALQVGILFLASGSQWFWGRSVVLFLLHHAPPIFVLALLYFIVRDERPFFARGVGYSIVAAIALSLGAVALCQY